MAQLIVKSDKGTFEIGMPEGKPIFVGRISECEVHLPSPAVSRRHAVFMHKAGISGLKDLGSSNGTFLNGNRVNNTVRLKNGDVIQIANFIIEYNAPGHTRPRREASSRKAQAAVAAAAPALDEEPVLAAAGVAAPEPEPIPGTSVEEPPPSAPAAAPEALEEDAAPMVARASPEPEAELAPKVDPEPEFAPEPAPEPVAEMDFADDESAPDDSAAKEESEAFEDTGEPPPDITDDVLMKIADRVSEGRTAGLASDEDETPPAFALDDDLPGTPPPPVQRPPALQLKSAQVADDEVGTDDRVLDDGEGASDAGDGEDSAEQAATALSKAAAEAGLVGEFQPDLEEEPGQPQPVVEMERDPNSIPLSARFREAIEARLNMYSFLDDLVQERADFLARKPKMSDSVKAELARQDRERDKIPTAAQAKTMLEKRAAKREDLKTRIKKAKETGEAMPPRPSRNMYEAEELANTQWTIIIDSLENALPAVYREGFRIMAQEPLAWDLKDSGLDLTFLMGGAAYFLALEQLNEEAKFERQRAKAELAKIAPAGGKKKKGVDPAEEQRLQKQIASLTEIDQLMASRANWIKQESAFMEKALIQEFWRLYTEIALIHIPNHQDMPNSVRAFLRHGVIGFQPWWMKDEVRQHIVEDVAQNVVHSVVISKAETNIVYADEYLAAVADWEITPAMDENLEINERNSPNWKADKALRRLINSRSQGRLMEELLEELDERSRKYQVDIDQLEIRINKLIPGSKNFKQVKNELGQRRQAFKVEVSKLGKLSEKIKTETLAQLKEAEEETNQRFESGELPKPTTEFIIKRECDAVHKIGRLLSNLKEKFMPLVVRDNFQVDTDAVNDRLSIQGEYADIERRDPGIFLKNLIPSKKRANRVDLRISPVIALLPAAGLLCFSWNPRSGPEDGRLAIPTCFVRRRIRERQLTYLMADFRWDTSKADAGMDVMTSETIVAAFMTVRWDWRKRSKEGREKGLIFNDQNDRTNWRRVYEAYLQTAFDAGKKLYQRNYDFYERIIGKYFDLPEGITLLKK